MKVVIAAGGTGGHLYPALAVAKALDAKGCEIVWLGALGRIEERVVPNHGYPFIGMKQKGLRGAGALSLFKAPWRLLSLVRTARKILKEERPQLVLGFGGFTAGPAGVAARSLHIPLVIHEQNAIPGLTNTWLSRIAQQTLLGFGAAQKKLPQGVVVGNPVRADIFVTETDTRNLSEPYHLLVLGGSLGAEHLNQVVPQVFQRWQGPQVMIHHQTGQEKAAGVQQAYGQQEASVVEFIEEMAHAYQQADVVIARSGALTCSELAAAGKASVLVPYPHAVDNHQYYNALALKEQEAAVIIEQQDCDAERLQAVLLGLLQQPQQVKRMGVAARQLAPEHAVTQIVAACELYLHKRA